MANNHNSVTDIVFWTDTAPGYFSSQIIEIDHELCKSLQSSFLVRSSVWMIFWEAMKGYCQRSTDKKSTLYFAICIKLTNWWSCFCLRTSWTVIRKFLFSIWSPYQVQVNIAAGHQVNDFSYWIQWKYQPLLCLTVQKFEVVILFEPENFVSIL